MVGRQRFTPEQIISKLREVDVLIGRGSSARSIRRMYGRTTCRGPDAQQPQVLIDESHAFHKAIGFDETERVVYFRKRL